MNYMNKAMVPEGLRYFEIPTRRKPFKGKGTKRKVCEDLHGNLASRKKCTGLKHG
jgi:hypothetical protein